MKKYFYVATELANMKRNYVATEFGQGQEFLCHDRVFLCRDRVFMFNDRVWPWAGVLCCEKCSYVAIKFGIDKRY